MLQIFLYSNNNIHTSIKIYIYFNTKKNYFAEVSKNLFRHILFKIIILIGQENHFQI